MKSEKAAAQKSSDAQLKELQQEKQALIDEKNKKDREWDDLADLKAQVDIEMKHFRLLLDNEEDRMGYVSP